MTQEPPTEPIAQPASPDPVPPTPEAIDAAIREYEELQEWLKDVEADVQKAKTYVIALVEGYGHPVPGSEQSRRLLGRRNEATVTRANTTTVNEEKVHDLLAYLSTDESTLLLFHRLFERQVKHRLVGGARDVLASVEMPRRVADKVMALFGKCFDVKPNAPSLKVRVIKPTKASKKQKAGKAGA